MATQSALQLARLARILGREIARGINDTNDDLQAAEARALRAADHVGTAASVVLDALAPWALQAAQSSRQPGGPTDNLLNAYRAYRQALADAAHNGD